MESFVIKKVEIRMALKRPHEDFRQLSNHCHVRFIDRWNAEKLCQTKLRKSSCSLLKKVLVQSTLQYIRDSDDDCFSLESDEEDENLHIWNSEESFFKRSKHEDEDIEGILCEMIVPVQSIILPPDDFDEDDWDDAIAIVPDVEIVERDTHTDFLHSIFEDFNNKQRSSSKPVNRCLNCPLNPPDISIIPISN